MFPNNLSASSQPNLYQATTQHPLKVDFGIQVDITYHSQSPQEILECDQQIDSVHQDTMLSQHQRKKQKKKLYMRRKKEKNQQMQRQARQNISKIVQQFYELTAHFEDYRDEIQLLVQIVYNYDFREQLDQLIRIRVEHIQKQLWEYTQSIFYCQSGQRNDEKVFCCCMVDEIYAHFRQIQSASFEIQKIINVYLKYVYTNQDDKDQVVYSNLAVNTFNYMIETDATLKELIQTCNKTISQEDYQHRKKLHYMISMLEGFQQQNQQHKKTSINWQEELQSTGYSEEDQLTEIRNKKKKKKVKQSDLAMDQDNIIQRLNQMVIEDRQRTDCRVSEQWINRISLKALKFRNMIADCR